MPGSRFPGLPAQFLGNGDGHRCAPARSLNERLPHLDSAPVVPGVNLVRPRLRLRALHVDPGSFLARVANKEALSVRPAYGRKNGVPFGDAILTTKALSEMPFCALAEAP